MGAGVIKKVYKRRKEKSFVSEKDYQLTTEVRPGLEDKNEGKRSQREASLIQDKISATEKPYRPFERSDTICPVAPARENVISMKRASSYRSMD